MKGPDLEPQTAIPRLVRLPPVPPVLHYHACLNMAEDGYTSSTAWESGDNSDAHAHGRPSFQSLDSVDENSSSAAYFTSVSPQPRSSSESRKSPTSQHWRDNGAVPVDRRDTLSTIHSGAPSLVEPTFDENVLRALCELDVC